MSTSPRLFVGLLATILLTVGFSSQVAAHARFVRSEPATEARLATAPQRVTIWFSQLVDPTGSSITVIDAAGATVSQGAAQRLPDDHKALRIELRPNLGPGQYTVQWATSSAEDDEKADGAFTFTLAAGAVGAPTPAAAVKPAAPTTSAATLIGEAAKDVEHVHEAVEKAEQAAAPAAARAAAKEVAEHGHEVEELLEKALAAAPAAARPRLQSSLDAMKTVVERAKSVQGAADADVKARVAELERAFTAFEQEFRGAQAAVGAPASARLPRTGEGGGASPWAAAPGLGLAGLGLLLAGLLRRRSRPAAAVRHANDGAKPASNQGSHPGMGPRM